MSKAILISIRPEYVVDILNGNKTLELRKSVPKDFNGWVYIYVTKRKPYIRKLGENYFTECSVADVNKLNGKVVARFWFDEYEKISLELVDKSGYDEDKLKEYESENMSNDELQHKLCLDEVEIDNYLNSSDGYAWHIKKLEIFDKPMELSDFYRNTNYGLIGSKLKRPPQSWQFVWVKDK